MISVLEPASYVSYNILALICCAALVPLVLTRIEQPQVPKARRLRPGLAWERSPLAVAGVVSAGLTTAAFRMVGPIYGVEVGLSNDEIALFLAAFVLGGALSQYPVGWAADRYDRRIVLIALSALAILSCAVMVTFAANGTGSAFATAGLFGLITFPIYSVATAHAHDFASQDERVDISAAFIFYYAVGAIASPWFVASLIDRFGPSAMFSFVSLAHVILIAFSLIRMKSRNARTRTRYVYAPRTSFVIGRLLGRIREGKDR